MRPVGDVAQPDRDARVRPARRPSAASARRPVRRWRRRGRSAAAGRPDRSCPLGSSARRRARARSRRATANSTRASRRRPSRRSRCRRPAGRRRAPTSRSRRSQGSGARRLDLLVGVMRSVTLRVSLAGRRPHVQRRSWLTNAGRRRCTSRGIRFGTSACQRVGQGGSDERTTSDNRRRRPCGRRDERRRRRAVPVLRQPREVPAVRHDDEREGRGRDAHRTRAHATLPTPPALRVFDAGTGNGVVLSHVLRDLHRRSAFGAIRGRRQGDQHGGHAPHARRASPTDSPSIPTRSWC